MKIGIIGTGNVGGTLGKRWARAGHEVTFGTRDPQADDVRALLKQAGPSASAAPVADAAARSEVVMLAVPWGAAKEVVESLGDLGGKVLIDAINPLSPQLTGLEIGTTSSAAEQVARWARGARVVKALNTVGFNIMENPTFSQGAPVMFYCGDDQAAKDTVRQLVEQLGFEPADAGALSQARVLEPFAMLWISLAFTPGHGRDFAFRLMRR